jgi:hypothetical protein
MAAAKILKRPFMFPSKMSGLRIATLGEIENVQASHIDGLLEL